MQTGDAVVAKAQPLARRIRRVVWIVVVNVLLTLALIEIALRAQQAFGPVYNLDLHREQIRIGLSDQFNHIHPPTDPTFDAEGIRRMAEPNAAQCAPRLLFMGDSFMEGLGIDDTIPVHVRDYFHETLHRSICVINAGCSSYSPSVYVPQAKKLIPQFKPDMVVIDVDETDLYDDYFRYRTLVTRDQSGSIVAVRRTPFADAFQTGLLRSVGKPLYLQRLLAKLYFTRVAYPRLFAHYHENIPEDIFWASRLPKPEARQQYGAAIRYFASTLDDLTESVVRLMGGPQGLVYIHHPHLENLHTKGDVFNSVVSDTIGEVAARHNVRYYDATADLKAAFGAEPERYYIPNDMHFNERGVQAYGLAVAKYLGTAIPGS